MNLDKYSQSIYKVEAIIYLKDSLFLRKLEFYLISFRT